MRPGQYLTRTLVWLDNRGVDGLVNGLAALFGGLSGRLRRYQTGFVRSYALSMVFGAASRGRRPPRGEVVVNIGWLTLTLLLPLAGALVTMAVPKTKALLSKQVALGFSLRHAGH